MKTNARNLHWLSVPIRHISFLNKRQVRVLEMEYGELVEHIDFEDLESGSHLYGVGPKTEGRLLGIRDACDTSQEWVEDVTVNQKEIWDKEE